MRSLLLLLSIVLTLSVKAESIDEQQARQQAEKFLQAKGATVDGTAVRPARRKALSSEQPLYVFNAADRRGFVIVAGDDRVDPIIGYTTQGRFDERELPENFRAWLEQTALEIESVKDRPAQARAAGSGARATVRKVAIHKTILPLIITKWDQGNSDNVYNSHLPLVNGKRPCTGCVATAGAQVMYYYHKDLPAETTSVPGYTFDNGEGNSNGADTSEDLPPIRFQWDKMKTRYDYKEPDAPNTPEEDAVADLMLYCGYAAQMEYGLNGSSASEYILAGGMCKYFGFNPDSWRYVYRSEYSVSDWDELIYNELASGRPVIYSGSYYGGHAFICDGYDGAGLYHFNWGWGGSYDGYFKLHATNPYGENGPSDMGYILNNNAIIGLQPSSWPDINDPNADDTWEVPEIEGIVATASNAKADGTMVTLTLGNWNEGEYAFGFGMGELNSDGTITPVDTDNEWYKTWGELGYGYYYSGVDFDFSSYELTDGTHTLVPICIVNGESEWRRCKPADIYFEVNVAGGAKTVIAHPVDNLQINEFDLAAGGMPGYRQGVVIDVTNNGDNIEKTLYLFVGTASETGSYTGRTTFRIASGHTKKVRIITNSMKAGTYTLRLFDAYSNGTELAKKEITISQDLKATKFEIVDNPVFSNSVIKVVATVENNAGDYGAPLYLYGSNGGTRDFFYAAGTGIEKGGSEDVTFYFTPDATGTWTLEVATDQDGKEVIGSTTVEVTSPPSGEVTLQLTDDRVQFVGNSAIYTMSVKNTGSTTNYREIPTWLYRKDGDTETNVDYKRSSKVTIEPGETKDVSVTFEGLENGKDYRVTSNYYTKYSGYSSKWLGYYEFTFTASGESNLPGDANGDWSVDAADLVEMVNAMNGEPSDWFILKNADMDGDNVITKSDIDAVRKLIMGE